ncbi:hypothetical protein GCM10007860_30030 [Chitiniphilus shinanonensis]|uniref:Lipoprotein n=1 Tax=Chitiniphilus shinanonensis TaxID=553088 RepID=A0ABQ6C1G4_9NEIS|nr:hypothetical protein [Chitiniphilus shinanonensis]GLS05844.1 hypothetical protein GCM10007860_30030 [Chitiniphilus shinanonensis]
MTKIGLIALLFVSAAAHAAPDLACYQSSANKRTYCIDRAEATGSGAMRAAPTYQLEEDGSSKPTGLSVLANCESKKTGLLDAKGNDITGGRTPSPVATALSETLCKLPTPKNNPLLPVL